MTLEMVVDVVRWLQTLGFDEYTASFVENRIDAEVLPLLTDDDLQTLGVNALGDRKKILKAIASLDAEDVGKVAQHPQPARSGAKPPAKKQNQNGSRPPKQNAANSR